MTHIVKQGFATPSRRFSVGQEVSAADVSGPVPFSRWVELGHLEPKPTPKTAKAAPEPKPEPPAAD